MSVLYATRGDVMAALDAAEGARSIPQIDRLLDRASRAVENLCGDRRFYPEQATRYINWPDDQLGTSWRIYLDAVHELISVTSITAGGVVVSGYFLEPQSAGPPYTRLEVDLTNRLSFDMGFVSGATSQRAITIVGTFGACNDFDLAVNTLAASLNGSATSLTVGTGQPIGVGALLRLDDELVQVTGKALASTTATITANLAASPGSTALTVADETLVAVGEVITIDSERMLVTDRTTGTLIVERQWSGSVLAAHTSGATIYAYRTLTVKRAQLGTTAAAHNSGADVDLFTPPPLVRDLTIAEALVGLAREQSGYARTVGSKTEKSLRGAGSVDDISDLRKQCYTAHGRKARLGVV